MNAQAQKSSQATDLPRPIRIGLLVDLYGNLLTERQRKFVLLHFNQDQSFGEIAQVFGVSRQAVHDAVKHAERSLEEYEAKLRLLERGIPKLLEQIENSPLPSDVEAGDDLPEEASEGPATAAEGVSWAGGLAAAEEGVAEKGGLTSQPVSVGDGALSAANVEMLNGIAEGLKSIRRRIQRSGGIIYDADGLNQEVGRLLARVEESIKSQQGQ